MYNVKKFKDSFLKMFKAFNFELLPIAMLQSLFLVAFFLENSL